ncbi:MAG: hypothetical protein LPL00_06540 [Alphaproteobacteria bacterium]|nr:hypothetical protein [Alphaproteobacteria bacterium]MDX5369205.1 hypothetical protein [Alphaproteobacteria bacterium]MDX5463901.1 hypothetical protein [Alphaproteobacteria bacterium]
MSVRGLLLLLGVALLSGGLAYWAPSPVRPALPVDEAEPALAFPALGPALDTVTRIRIEEDDGLLLLVRNSASWEVAVDGGEAVAADGDRVAALLGGLAGLRLAEEKTRLPGRHGLIAVDDPADGGGGARITVYDLDDRVRADLILGTVRIPPAPGLPGEMFVRRPDAVQAWLARGSLHLPAAGAWAASDEDRLPK